MMLGTRRSEIPKMLAFCRKIIYIDPPPWKLVENQQCCVRNCLQEMSLLIGSQNWIAPHCGLVPVKTVQAKVTNMLRSHLRMKEQERRYLMTRQGFSLTSINLIQLRTWCIFI